MSLVSKSGSTAPGAARRYAPATVLGLFYLCLGLVARVVLWARFGTAADVPMIDLPWILLAGLVNDAVESLYLLTPLMLYLFLVSDRWYRSRWNGALLTVGSVLTFAGMAYLAVTEFFFFEEFDSRFNLVAFDYLRYPVEVFTDIWQAYPVFKAMLATAALAVIMTRVLRSKLMAGLNVTTSLGRRAVPFALYVVALLAVITWYPTNALSRSSNRVENEILQNGYSSFFRAAQTNEIDYHAYYASSTPKANLKLLTDALAADGGKFTRLAEGRLDRSYPARPDGLGRLNVVVVASESFGAKFSKLYGSSKDLTPNFDAFAQRGVWFSNTYASGTRTVRGLEATSLGTPPVPGQAIVRRPGNDHLATIGEILEHQGFATSFVYGGYGYFDNMNAYFDANDYRVVDRTEFPKPSIVFENIWGVADESLFDSALKVIEENMAQGKRTFTHIMTTSNHRPFTYPDGRIDIPSPGGREGAVKYTDWAIGRFVEEARRRPWFDDTLFVFLADHCAAVAGKSKLPVAGYRIPLIFYAPKLVGRGTYEPVASQIDLPPTLLDVLRVEGDDHFFGRSVFELPAVPARAFVSNYQSLGYLRDGTLVVLSPGRKVETFRVDPATFETTPTPPDRALADEAIAYYQTASRAFKQGALKAPGYAPH